MTNSPINRYGCYQAFLDSLLDRILEITGDVAYAERLAFTLLTVYAGRKPAYLDDDITDMDLRVLKLIEEAGNGRLKVLINDNVSKSLLHGVYPAKTIIYNHSSVNKLVLDNEITERLNIKLPIRSEDIIKLAFYDDNLMGIILGFKYPARSDDKGKCKFIRHVVNTGISADPILIWSEACYKDTTTAQILHDILDTNKSLNNLFGHFDMSVESIVEAEDVYTIKKQSNEAHKFRLENSINTRIGAKPPAGVQKHPKDPQSPLRTMISRREEHSPPRCLKRKRSTSLQYNDNDNDNDNDQVELKYPIPTRPNSAIVLFQVRSESPVIKAF